MFILGALAFGSAYFGRRARRKRRNNGAKLHITGMGMSYVLLLTAFYVDNGKSLPLWKELPPIALWLIPRCRGHTAYYSRAAAASFGAVTATAPFVVPRSRTAETAFFNRVDAGGGCQGWVSGLRSRSKHLPKKSAPGNLATLVCAEIG